MATKATAGPVALLVVLALASFVEADEGADMLAAINKMRTDAQSGKGNAQEQQQQQGLGQQASQRSGATAQGAPAYGGDWRDSSWKVGGGQPSVTKEPTSVTGFLSNTDPKNRAIITGVAAGSAVAALAGGIAIAIEETKIHRDIEAGRPVKPLFPWMATKANKGGQPTVPSKTVHSVTVTTALSKPLQAGVSTLPITSQAGFHMGDSIVLDQGTLTEEVNTIVGFGSIVLKNPLKFPHPSGTIISSVPKAQVPAMKAAEELAAKPGKPVASMKAAEGLAAKPGKPVATTTAAATVAIGDEIPTPLVIALGLLVFCCCAALFASVVQAMFYKKTSKSSKRSAKKSMTAERGELARGETSRSDSVETFDSYEYENESYYSTAASQYAPSAASQYASVAPQEYYTAGALSGYTPAPQEYYTAGALTGYTPSPYNYPPAQYPQAQPATYNSYSPQVQPATYNSYSPSVYPAGVTVTPYAGY